MLTKIDFLPNVAPGIFVTWTLHNFCNYRCSYCPPGCHAGTKRPYTADDVIRFSLEIVKAAQMRRYEHFTIAFSGGEPTLFPEFERILEVLYANKVDVIFTSNGSRNLEFWKKVTPHFNHCVWSFHPQFANWNDFYEKARFVSQHCWLNVDFMMTAESFEQNLEYAREMAKLDNVRVDFVPIQKNFGGESEGLIGYSDEQLRILQNVPYKFKEPTGEVLEKRKKFLRFGRGLKFVESIVDGKRVEEILNYKSLIAKNQNNFKGWTCLAGIESLVVDMDGSVKRAYCNEGGVIGDIWNPVSLPTKPVICTMNSCKCSVDIEVSKYAEGEY